MTEKEKMLAGEVYDATSRELIAELQATREVLHEFNMLRPSETQRMKEILKGLLGHVADIKDIPSNTVAVGNPCKVIKQIGPSSAISASILRNGRR